jgi:DNA-binding transcriptional MerR regulator
VNQIEFIKRLRATGMPVREMVHYTDLMRQGETTIAARLDLLKQHRRRVEDAQREVDHHLAAITAKIAYYQEQHAQSVHTTMPFPTCSEEEHAVAQKERDNATDYSWT